MIDKLYFWSIDLLKKWGNVFGFFFAILTAGPSTQTTKPIGNFQMLRLWAGHTLQSCNGSYVLIKEELQYTPRMHYNSMPSGAVAAYKRNKSITKIMWVANIILSILIWI